MAHYNPPPFNEDQHHGSLTGIFGKYEEYIGEFVYGGIDGAITTFAVVAGAAGAGLSTTTILILGFANLIADGFSMAVGAFLGKKTEKESYDRNLQNEYWEIDNLAEIEREEIRDIYRKKGFEGDDLERAVHIICDDKDRWADEMMKHELHLMPVSKSPWSIGVVTFFAFNTVGFVPLLVYVLHTFWPLSNEKLFFWSSLATTVAFVLIGALKSRVNNTPLLRSILETVALGSIAAILAYAAGFQLEQWLGDGSL